MGTKRESDLPGVTSWIFLMAFFLNTSYAMGQLFFDDFNGKMARKKWRIADRKWGERHAVISHGGVVPQNVLVRNGNLVLAANGDTYAGNVKGHGQNRRVGAALFTRKKFGAARYEIKAKICPQPGVLSAFWTFFYEGESANHEIDFEIPGRSPDNERDMRWGTLSNWTGLSEKEHQSVNKFFGDQIDGEYHVYRIDWYTGIPGETPRVEWYFDNRLLHTSYQAIPSKPSRLWIGLWFPWWLGNADFNTDYMYIDWVKISSLR